MLMTSNSKRKTKSLRRPPFFCFSLFVTMMLVNLAPSSNATTMPRAAAAAEEEEENQQQRQLQNATTPAPSTSMEPAPVPMSPPTLNVGSGGSSPAPSSSVEPAPVPFNLPTLDVSLTEAPVSPPTDGPPTQEPEDGGGAFGWLLELLAVLISYLLGLDKRGGDRPAGYVAPAGRFRLKLHWQDDYEWQNSDSEMRYCMTCTRCDRFNFANNGATSSPFNCRTGTCAAGDQLWTRRCDEGYGDVFEVLDEGHADGVLVRAVTGNNNVCLTRVQTRYLALEPCDGSRERQKFQFFTTGQPFELKPMYLPFYHFGRDGSHCVTQPHHPKSQELFGIKDCAAEDDNDTRLWNAFELADGSPSNPPPSPTPPTNPPPSPTPPTNPPPSPPTDPAPAPAAPTNPTPTPPTSPTTPLELDLAGNDGSPGDAFPLQKCEGDCDDNGDCATGLLCYQRFEDGAPVPGCFGDPRDDEYSTPDYCVDPDDIPDEIQADSALWNVARPDDW